MILLTTARGYQVRYYVLSGTWIYPAPCARDMALDLWASGSLDNEIETHLSTCNDCWGQTVKALIA